MSSDLRSALRRLKPEKRIASLRRRDDKDLPFLGEGPPPDQLLFDSTFYVDLLQGRLPAALRLFTLGGRAWHSAVSLGEVAFSLGRLDPRHPGTRTIAERIASLLDRAPADRTVEPDRSAWREACLSCGILARTQGYSAGDRQRLLNDSLIYFTALGHGCTVLTRNVADFDLLLQLVPQGRVAFYRAAA